MKLKILKTVALLAALAFAVPAAAECLTEVTATIKNPAGLTPAQANLPQIGTVAGTAVYGHVTFTPLNRAGKVPTRIICEGVTFAPQQVRAWVKADGTLMSNSGSVQTLVPTIDSQPTNLVYAATIFLPASRDGSFRQVEWTEIKELPNMDAVDWGDLAPAAASGQAVFTYQLSNAGAVLDYEVWYHKEAADVPTPAAGRVNLFFDSVSGTLRWRNSDGSLSSLGAGTITVEEEDGNPSLASISTVRFDQADGFVVSLASSGIARIDLSGVPQSAIANLTTDLSGKQPLDADLTAIAALACDDDEIIKRTSGAWACGTDISGGGGGSFLSLTDTPSSFSGQGGKYLRVNTTPDAIEFRTTAEVLSDIGAAAASHGHAISDVTGLQTALDGKQAVLSGINALSFGTGAASTVTLTGDVSGTDAVITFGNGVVNVTTGTLQQGGTAVSLAGHTHAGGDITSAVATATALAADPTDCSANQFATAIAASGNLTCAQPSSSNLSDSSNLPLLNAANIFTADGGVTLDATDPSPMKRGLKGCRIFPPGRRGRSGYRPFPDEEGTESSFHQRGRFCGKLLQTLPR
jgi:hypothetical protein